MRTYTLLMQGIAIGFAALCAVWFVGCGNMSLVDWHWTFDEAIIKTPDGKCMTVKVKNWHDFERSDMVQIETADKVFCTHSANVILIKHK